MAPRRSGVFSPGGGVSVQVTNVSARVPLPPGNNPWLHLVNTGAAAVHVAVGGDAIEATIADPVIAPGDARDMDFDPRDDAWLAAISPAAGPTVLQVSRASGAAYV